MHYSYKPIIKHIPQFLENCRKTGLSDRTHDTYKRYLNKFILWLREKNKTSLFPHDLTSLDIQSYKSYLANHTDKKGIPLKKISQNYYLIALRAFLSYFTAKDIVSLPVAKISLPKTFKAEKTAKILTSNQIDKLLSSPNTQSVSGLRDRLILEVLISTGLKVNQLTELNKEDIKDLPKDTLLWAKKYLNKRMDKNNALFINFKAKKDSIGNRLTTRSIERIVKYYGQKASLSYSLTPENLRWAKIETIANREINIKEPRTHGTLETNEYSPLFKISPINGKTSNNLKSWNYIEKNINNEITWLKQGIPVLTEEYKENPPFLKHDDTILRKIAILIVSGNVVATEFKLKNKDIWHEKIHLFNTTTRHGKEWHRKMIDLASFYFNSRGYKTIIEPILNYGRSDMGIILNENKTIFVEIGTVSLFKVWYNLSTMKDIILLIIPDEKTLIEFRSITNI